MSKPRLLLVGWDAADWKLIHPLIDSDRMPTLQRVVEEGVSGSLESMEPSLSPLLWTSIATGKRAYDHGVHGFTQVDPVSGRVVPVSAADRRCRALWEILGERGLKSHVIGWLATHGEQGFPGCLVSDLYPKVLPGSGGTPGDTPPTPPGTYWPEDLRSKLDPLRVGPGDMDGDAIIRLFVPDAPKVDQTRDRRLWQLAEQLARAFSIHAAACHLLEHEPDWDFAAVYYPAIDEIGHEFMAFHPPQMEGIPDEEFRLYQQVMEGAYRLHDLLLGRLLQLAGPDTAVMVVSDHGFHSDHHRPRNIPEVSSGITAWHRRHGVFAAWGPRFATDALVHGAGLLDITPTILTWFGLPVGADMEGRVLREIFTEPPEVKTIPTWETQEAERRRCALSREEEERVVQQFRDLGYLDDASADPTENAERTCRDNAWNLARALLDGGRLLQALPLLEDVYFRHPERTDHAQHLALCQRHLGLLEESRATIESCLDACGDSDLGRLIRARFAVEDGNLSEGLQLLESVSNRAPRNLATLELMGLTLLRLRRWDACAEVCNTALEVDPDNVTAWLGLSRCSLARRLPKEAAEQALEAIGRQYGSAQGHFLLGVALWQDRQFAAAAAALRTALRLAPALDSAGRILARILRELGDPGPSTEAPHRHASPTVALVRNQDPRIEALRAECRQRDAARRATRHHRRTAQRFTRVEPPEIPLPAGEEFVIVSGLPRSGTSLMMQMLQAGGLPPMTDGLRAADLDNPEGYLEWEAIRQLPQAPRLIEQTRGHAVKVISALLGHLPGQHRYKVILMKRPLDEVVASQERMRERREVDGGGDMGLTRRALENHFEEIRKSLGTNPNIEVLEVDYPSLVSDPIPQASRVAEFLGRERLPHADTMASCVRPHLHRQVQPTTPPNSPPGEPTSPSASPAPSGIRPESLPSPSPGAERSLNFRWAWPDERLRAASLFPHSAFSSPSSRCFVAVVEHPVERIVGAAWLQTTEGSDALPTGEFLWAMLPAFASGATETEFLKTFVTAVRETTGLERIRTATPLLESSTSDQLRGLGFEPAYKQDFYRAPDIWAASERIERFLDRIPLREQSLEVLSPRPEHQEALLDLVSRQNRLLGEREVEESMDRSGGSFDPGQSAVAVHEGQVVGVCLARVKGDGCLHVAALTGEGRPSLPTGVVVARVLQRVIHSVPPSFAGAALFRTNPVVSPTMPAMGRRLGFQKVASATAWRLRLQPS